MTKTTNKLVEWAVAYPAPTSIRIIDGSTGLSIADIVTPCNHSAAKSKDEAKSFARCIAAAPELHNFAETVASIGEEQLAEMDLSLALDCIRTMQALANAVICKARGQG